MERLNRVLVAGLALTHLIWGLSLLVEPSRFTHKIMMPSIFAIIHIATAGLLVTGTSLLGLALSTAILGYYWALVKPLEPIAEPQTVGILAISAAGLLSTLSYTRNISKHIARAGLAYPFIEWGLDALRNPGHFAYYLTSNPMTNFLTTSLPIYTLILILGLYEIVLGIWVFAGTGLRYSSATMIATLAVFAIVAGYPLALPQNISLITAAWALGWGRFSSSS
jgi:hypothetical protein